MPDRLMKSLLVAFERANAHARRGLQLSANEFLVLFHLWMREGGGMTMGEIGSLVNVTSGGLTALVDRLERSGFVERTPDELDRRRILLTATDKAGVVRSAYLGALDDADAALRRLPEVEQGTVREYLTSVTKRMGNVAG